MSAQEFAKRVGAQGGEAIRRYAERAQRFHVGGIDVNKLVSPAERTDKNTLVATLQKRLLQTALAMDKQKALQEFLDSKTQLTDADILTVIRLIMSTPEYQIA